MTSRRADSSISRATVQDLPCAPFGPAEDCSRSMKWSSSDFFSGDKPVGIVNTELNENMDLARLSQIPPFGARRLSRGRRQRVGRLQIASHTPVGEPRPPAPTRAHPRRLANGKKRGQGS